jgi:hypothetical protein
MSISRVAPGRLKGRPFGPNLGRLSGALPPGPDVSTMGPLAATLSPETIADPDAAQRYRVA